MANTPSRRSLPASILRPFAYFFVSFLNIYLTRSPFAYFFVSFLKIYLLTPTCILFCQFPKSIMLGPLAYFFVSFLKIYLTRPTCILFLSVFILSSIAYFFVSFSSTIYHMLRTICILFCQFSLYYISYAKANLHTFLSVFPVLYIIC